MGSYLSTKYLYKVFVAFKYSILSIIERILKK